MVRSAGHGTEEGHAWVLTMAQAQVQYVAQERPRQEMQEKARGRTCSSRPRGSRTGPSPVYTEFMESDTEIEHGDDRDDDSEVYSEFGDLEGIEDGECSPRISVGSVPIISSTRFQLAVAAGALKGGRKLTSNSPASPALRPSRPTTKRKHHGRCKTAASCSTKTRSSRLRGPGDLICSAAPCRQRNPSSSSMHSPSRPSHPRTCIEDGSPPPACAPHSPSQEAARHWSLPVHRRGSSTPRPSATWTPEMVAQWMLNAGVELSASERFVENDINGAIVITLESGGPEGAQHLLLWREGTYLGRDPQDEELLQPPRADARDPHRGRAGQEGEEGCGGRRVGVAAAGGRGPESRSTISSPLESVSIVGIEQVLPKPHNCSKGRGLRQVETEPAPDGGLQEGPPLHARQWHHHGCW